MEKVENQKCMFCGKNKLTLSQDAIDIPYFGKVFVFSMSCSECNFVKSDVEAENVREPCKITFEVKSVKDLKVRVVKSSNAIVKIPELRMSVRPGPAAEGYVSNVEGVIDRFKKIVENVRDNSDDDKEKKSAKNLLKKIWKVKCGEIPVKIMIEDPTGNSGIISDKANVVKK